MIVKCEECGSQISDRAVACPHCGAPYTAYDSRTGGRRDNSTLRTALRDLDVPFGSLIVMTVKLLPAMLILGAIIGACVAAGIGAALEQSNLIELLQRLPVR
jgi:uncharacterized membrane protein YvbJ